MRPANDKIEFMATRVKTANRQRESASTWLPTARALQSASAKAIIDELELRRHPGGGWFGETLRAHASNGRAAISGIYFLIERGECLPWHKVDAVEVWHYYAGAPLALSLSRGGRHREDLCLGPNIFAGERPQLVVPAFHWQRTETTGDWSLAGCTVTPGYVSDNIRVAPVDWQAS